MQRNDRTIRTRVMKKLLRRNGAKILATATFAFTVMLMVASCDQSAIFYNISKETEPKDPVIPGSPSNMVMFPAASSDMWISNGKLHVFNGTSWSNRTGPGGIVRSLAVAQGYLYALTVDGGDGTTTKVWRTADGTSWTVLTIASGVSNYSFLESIYAAGPAGNETLFVGAHIPAGEADPISAYGILYANGTSLEAMKINLEADDAAGALIGAAYDGTGYYLATAKLGIFYNVNPTTFSATAVTGSAGIQLSGLIFVGGKVVAGSRDNLLLYGSSGGFTAKDFGDFMFIGPMATWDETGDGTDDLLLLPIDDDSDSYTYGYKEILLSGGIFPSDPTIKSPGSGTPTTVADNDQYDAALGQEAVRSLFQYDFGGTRVLFASTYKDGLWSYRDDEWNAEE